MKKMILFTLLVNSIYAKEDKKSELKHEKKLKKITLTNCIERSNLKYRRAGMDYYPYYFVITVNGTRVPAKQSIVINDATFDLEYRYEWHTPIGKKRNGFKVKMHLPENATTARITFGSWDEKNNRIHISGAKIEKEENIKVSAKSFDPEETLEEQRYL